MTDSHPKLPLPEVSSLFLGLLARVQGPPASPHENKTEVQVYDYADVSVPMLVRMYKKRLAGYAALGYAIAETQASHAKL